MADIVVAVFCGGGGGVEIPPGGSSGGSACRWCIYGRCCWRKATADRLKDMTKRVGVVSGFGCHWRRKELLGSGWWRWRLWVCAGCCGRVCSLTRREVRGRVRETRLWESWSGSREFCWWLGEGEGEGDRLLLWWAPFVEGWRRWGKQDEGRSWRQLLAFGFKGRRRWSSGFVDEWRGRPLSPFLEASERLLPWRKMGLWFALPLAKWGRRLAKEGKIFRFWVFLAALLSE